MVNWTHVTIPETPTPRLVHVTYIAPEATDDKVKEFFLFCGKISEFEVVTAENGEKEALILFEKETASKTATMLSNAVIADKPIHVEYYFKDEYGTGEHQGQIETPTDGSEITQEEKPKTSIVTELLAHGFALSSRIIKAAQDFDSQHGVSTRVSSYYEQARGKLDELDKHYKARELVITRANTLNESYSITDNIYYVAQQMQTAASRALETAPGKQATELLNQAKSRAIETVNESRKLADTKLSS